MSNEIRNTTNRAAFSLLEALIAFVVFAMILIPILTIFSVGNKGVQMSEEDLAVHHAGIELMEQLLSFPGRFLPVGTLEDAVIADNCRIASECPFRFHLSSIPGIRRKVTITEHQEEGMVPIKSIDVSIRLVATMSKFLNRETHFRTAVIND